MKPAHIKSAATVRVNPARIEYLRVDRATADLMITPRDIFSDKLSR
jgi:hypothetical protein